MLYGSRKFISICCWNNIQQRLDLNQLASGGTAEQDPLCLRIRVIKKGTRISLEFLWVLKPYHVESYGNSEDPDRLVSLRTAIRILSAYIYIGILKIESVYHVIKYQCLQYFILMFTLNSYC